MRGKKLPAQLVRSTGLFTRQGTPREEWATLARAAKLSEITNQNDSGATVYRNVHTGNQRVVKRQAGMIHKSRQSFVRDVRRRVWKKASGPKRRQIRKYWTDEFGRDYDRHRARLQHISDYLENEGPAVDTGTKLERDRNGRLWSVNQSLTDCPDGKPQRRFVCGSGPEPEVARRKLELDVLDVLERLVAHRESLHQEFEAGWKAEKRGGDWQKHQAKANARRSHQWTAKNGTGRPQFVSVGRWREKEIDDDALEGQRAVTVPWVVFDIDADTKERCAELGRRLVERLSEYLSREQMGQVLVSYTGGTSVHIRVPAGFLGNPIYKNEEAAAETLSEFADELCQGLPEVREAIDDRLFHPRQLVRMIGSTYEEDTPPPDNSGARAWLVRQLLFRPQIKGRDHAEEVADQVLDTLRERHLSVQDVNFRFCGEHPVTIEGATDQTPNANRVVATTARDGLLSGPEPLWARSRNGAHQPFELPDPTEAEHVPKLASLLSDRSAPLTKRDTPSVEKSTGEAGGAEYERALDVDREGEKWGRDVDKPHLVGRNRAALTISLVHLTRSDAPWRETCTWNRQMDEPLPERELRSVYRSAKDYLHNRD